MSQTTPDPVLTKPFVIIAVFVVFIFGQAFFGDKDKHEESRQGVDSVRVDSTYARLM